MEQAFEEVKPLNSKSMYCWIMSNLGDMYWHAGRMQESYKAYLGVLQKDTSYIHALKGIAWIAYSHDNNTVEAKRILLYILSQTKMPDLYITLAEIAEWEGDIAHKEIYIRKFLSEVEQSVYGEMYNKYLIKTYISLNQFDRAQAIAEREVNSRPTPETYDWLAWTCFKKAIN